VSRREKRKALVHSLMRGTAGVSFLLLAYGYLPLSAATNRALVIRVIVAAIMISLFVVAEIKVISRSEFPQLRAADALLIGVTLILVVFASIYLSMSRADASSFSEPLGRTGAMYLTMTTLSTVGYGDVVAKTDAARITVMIQMVFNVAFIGLAVKWISFTARRRLESTDLPAMGELDE
jgi:voltage-gated potassium channel